ncbi:extensin family protein [Rhizobium sp. 0TCS1.26]|uniref:extensin-like domain-containing protein n=1 Tax=Rhizobium sp. 0TCS1.26 TaxID=3142623 RepID=UPI003D2C9795
MAPVVNVNFLDRLLQDGKPRRRTTSQRQRTPRQSARPSAARAQDGSSRLPALATIPVPTPKPPAAQSAVEQRAPTETMSDTPPVAPAHATAPDASESTSAPKGAAPAPTVEQPGTASEPPHPAEVPKPLPKPVEERPAAPPAEDSATPSPGAATPPADKAQPAPAPTQPEPDTTGKPEQKAEEPTSPPPPPLEKEDPEALKACLADLTALGTKFETKPAIIGEEPGCGIEQPIAVDEILPGVKTGGAEMRCETAHALAHWMKDNVQPAMSVAMPGRRVTGIVPGSTYACRLRNSASTGKVSEHARGNAIDVAAFKLDNGETFTMKPRNEDSTLEGAFQRAATATACLYFSTVLSPGSDAAHEDHLHLDVLDRRNGYRYCR